jgi:hypothetical protein
MYASAEGCGVQGGYAAAAWGSRGFPVPREKLVDALGRVILQARQHVGERVERRKSCESSPARRPL